MARQSRSSESLYEGVDTRDVDSFAMWAFVLSLSPLIIAWMPFVGLPLSIIASIIAIALAIASLGRIKRSKDLKGKAFAISAIVIAALMLLSVGLFVMVLVETFVNS